MATHFFIGDARWKPDSSGKWVKGDVPVVQQEHLSHHVCVDVHVPQEQEEIVHVPTEEEHHALSCQEAILLPGVQQEHRHHIFHVPVQREEVDLVPVVQQEYHALAYEDHLAIAVFLRDVARVPVVQQEHRDDDEYVQKKEASSQMKDDEHMQMKEASTVHTPCLGVQISRKASESPLPRFG